MGALHAPGGFGGSGGRIPERIILSSISPTSGAVATTVTCTGKGFTKTSVCNLAGSGAAATTFVDEQTLTFDIDAGATQAAHNVTVTDSWCPASEAVSFTVTA